MKPLIPPHGGRRARTALASGLALLVLGAVAPAQQWNFLDGPVHSGRMATFDPARGHLIWLGLDGVTWELDGDELLDRAVAGPVPPPRTRAVLVYDLARRRALLFGGADGTRAMLDDTWVYDGERWTQLQNGPVPPRRVDAASTYDSVRDRVVMFGGQQLFLGHLQDTWEHDGAQWTQRQPATVPPGGLAMSYDLVRQVTVMVSGSGIVNTPITTWEWNGVDWAQRAATGPFTSSNAGMAYDFVRARTVLVGGVGTSGIWEWDGVSWQNVSVPNPPMRLDPAVHFDPTRGVIRIVGGTDFVMSGATVMQVAARTDTLEYDGATITRVRGDLRPTFRDGHLWVGDRARGEIVLFGGSRQSITMLEDTWTWDGRTWTERAPPTVPPARTHVSGIYDLQRGRALMFGGIGSGTMRNDLWAWNGVDWTLLDNGTGPSGRSTCGMAFDFVRGRAVLFGGWTGGTLGPSAMSDQTWEWDGTSWTRILTTNSPSPREGAAMEFDPGRNRVVLFGGRVGATVNDQLADTWEYDGVDWTQLQPLASPPALLQPSLALDPTVAGVVLVGNELIGSSATTQVWRFTGGTWTRLDSATSGFLGGPFAMDPRRHRLVASGVHVLAEWTTTPAQTGSIGTGCGAPAPRLLARTRPRIGQPSFGFESRGASAAPALFAIGDAQAALPLGGGCTLHVGGNVATVFAVGSLTGDVEIAVPIPASVALRGFALTAQAALLDPAAPLGFALTQGLAFTVGD